MKTNMLKQLKDTLNVEDYNYAIHQIKSDGIDNKEISAEINGIFSKGLKYEGDSIRSKVLSLGSAKELTESDFVLNDLNQNYIYNIIIAAPKKINNINFTFPKRDLKPVKTKYYIESGLVDLYCNQTNKIDKQMILGLVVTDGTNENFKFLLNPNHLSQSTEKEQNLFNFKVLKSDPMDTLRQYLINPEKALETMRLYNINNVISDYLADVVKNKTNNQER